MGRYMKLFAALLATVLSALVAALVDDHVAMAEWINISIAAVTAAAVFTAPNIPGSRYTKAVLAGLGAALALLVSFITDGVSVSEWVQIAIAVLGTLGVTAVPNATGQTTPS